CPDYAYSALITNIVPLIFPSLLPRPLRSTLFPYTTLFRSQVLSQSDKTPDAHCQTALNPVKSVCLMGHRPHTIPGAIIAHKADRSEEHTSELQSRFDLVCRLLLEKKKK